LWLRDIPCFGPGLSTYVRHRLIDPFATFRFSFSILHFSIYLKPYTSKPLHRELQTPLSRLLQIPAKCADVSVSAGVPTVPARTVSKPAPLTAGVKMNSVKTASKQLTSDMRIQMVARYVSLLPVISGGVAWSKPLKGMMN
jgi:hypothetical protein